MTEVDFQHPVPDIAQHTLPQSLVLHLLPGVLGGAAYYALAPLVRARGFSNRRQAGLHLADGLRGF